MLLVDPQRWERMKQVSDSVKVKEENENLIRKKIFEDNQKNKQ